MFNKSSDRYKPSELATILHEAFRRQPTDLVMNLQIESTNHEASIELRIREHSGNQFDVTVEFTHNELILHVGQHFYAYWSYEKKEIEEFRQVVTGLLNGTSRVVEYHYKGKYLKSELYHLQLTGWKIIGTNFGKLVCLERPLVRWISPEKNILQAG